MSERKRGDCAGTPTYSEWDSRMEDAGRKEVEPGRIDMREFISIREVALRSSMSEKIIRSYVRNDALPHWRNSKTGKIWLRWSDFIAWMERRRIELRHDDGLLGILRDMRKARR